MRTIQSYRTRLPLYFFALIDLTLPFGLLWLIHAVSFDQPWKEIYNWMGFLAGVFMVFGILLLNGYSRYSERSLAQKLELVFKVWTYIVFILIFIAFLYVKAQEFSRFIVVMWAIVTPFTLLLMRLMISRASYLIEQSPIRVLILGAYVFTDFEQSRFASRKVEIKVVDQFDDLAEQVNQFTPNYVVLNLHGKIESSLVRDLTHIEMDGAKLIKMDLFMESFLRKCFINYQSEDLSYLEQVKAYSRFAYFLKRLVDIAGALVLGFITIPVMLYALIKIRKESPGAVLFVQERVGLNGKPFKLYKFRSMHENAYFDPYTQAEDSRIFNFGKIMRKTRIDELPQLWNVLKGDMHLLGPRSEWTILVGNYEKDIPFYHERHLVAPGISGWAQVMYPYGCCVEDARQKLMYDLYYIKNWSIWLEIETLIRTIGVVLGKKGL